MKRVKNGHGLGPHQTVAASTAASEAPAPGPALRSAASAPPRSSEPTCPAVAERRGFGEDNRMPKTRLMNAPGARWLILGASFGFTALAMLSLPEPVGAQQPPSSAGPADPGLIEDLVAANRILATQGIFDAYGHVSVRHDRDPDRFLMARSVAPELVTAEDLLEYDLDGNPVNLAGRSQFLERFIHAAIYRARSDVVAVVHSHSPSVIPFGISSVPMRPVYHMSAFIGEGLPVFDIRDAAGITGMLVDNGERGRALVESLSASNGILMRGHGAVVVAPSLPLAVARSVYLELNARIQLQAIELGGPITYLDPLEAKAVVDAGELSGFARAWEMWERQLLRDP